VGSLLFGLMAQAWAAGTLLSHEKACIWLGDNKVNVQSKAETELGGSGLSI
jgi:hypothetical protein